MRALPFLLVIFFLTSVLAVPVPSSDSENGEEPLSALSDDWRIEIVETTGYGGADNSISIDRMNKPHIVYYPPGLVRYAVMDGDIWRFSNVSQTAFGGASADIAVDGIGRPHVVFDAEPPYCKMYALLEGGAWHVEGIEPQGDCCAHTPPSIAVDSHNQPHVVYDLEGGGGHSREVRYAFRNENGWATSVIDRVGERDFFGRRIDIAIDSADRPHIAYYNGSTKTLYYAYNDGTTWLKEQVDSNWKTGFYLSIDLDSQDIPSVSYADGSDWDLKFARRELSSWNLTTVQSQGDTGGFTSLALDVNGFPKIAYYDWTSSSILFAEYENETWNIETVYSNPILHPRWPSLDLDQCDNPHVSFYSFYDQSIEYATRGPPCPIVSGRIVSLNINPNTLNLKSRGRWISARLSAENASVHDIDVSTILLQDTLVPERWDNQDDILMLKFNRQELQSLLQVGDSIEIKLSGKWKDGSEFEAYDYIRVINPGKK